MPKQAKGFLQGQGIQSTAKGDNSFQQVTGKFPTVAPVSNQLPVKQRGSYQKAQRYDQANPLKGYEFRVTQAGGLKPSTNAQLTIAPGQALPLGTIRTVGGSNKNK